MTAVRSAHRILRQRPVDTEAIEEWMWTGDVWRTPERELFAQECHLPFQRAATEAFASLEGDDRRALRKHYRDGHSIDVLAEAWDVHRATAARRLARARANFREAVLERLESDLELSQSSAVRYARAAQSHLDLDQDFLLESEPT